MKCETIKVGFKVKSLVDVWEQVDIECQNLAQFRTEDKLAVCLGCARDFRREGFRVFYGLGSVRC